MAPDHRSAASGSVPDWEDVPRAPSRWRTVGLGLAVVLVVGLLVRPASTEPDGSVLDVEDPVTPGAATPEPTPTITRRPPSTTPTPSPSQRPTLAGQWASGAGAPEPLSVGSARAWDGDRRLFFYGGQTWLDNGARTIFHDQALVYDVEADSWAVLPPAPLEPRFGASAVWTGSEFVVWGGIGRASMLADGAAYDPERDTWRTLGEAPLLPRHGAAAVWTGDALLVVGGWDNAGPHSDSALYDPASDRWESGPDLPAGTAGPGLQGTGVMHEGTVVVTFTESWSGTAQAPLRLEGAKFTETRLPLNTGRSLVVPPVAAPGRGLVGMHGGWGGTGFEAGLIQLAPGSDTWESLGDVDLGSDGGIPGTAVLDGRYYVVISTEGRAQAFDLVEGGWLDLPRMERRLVEIDGTRVVPIDGGLAVVVVGDSAPGGSSAQVWRFTADL